MHRYLLPLVVTLICLTARGQTKTYVTSEGTYTTDASKGKSYVLLYKSSDTTYLMKQYSLQDSIMAIVTFKDDKFTIMHGPCTYYTLFVNPNKDPELIEYYEKKGMKSPVNKDDPRPARVNYIATKGQFKNGQRFGEWTDYWMEGGVNSIYHYDEKGELTGPQTIYNFATKLPVARGSLVNGLKEGYWQVLDPHGMPITKEYYSKGVLVRGEDVESDYKKAEPTPAFKKSARLCLTDLYDKHILKDMTILVTGKVSAVGKFTAVAARANKGNDKMEPQTLAYLIKALDLPELWKPALSHKEPVDDDVILLQVAITNGIVNIEYVNNEATSRLFRLTH